jgi:hypothetical protein
VTDSTQSGRAARNNPGSGVAPVRRGRVLVVGATVLLLIGSTVIGYLLGRDMARNPLEAATLLIQQLEPENRKLKATTLSQNAAIIELRAQLKKVQATLNEIRPSENTYNINGNQSLIVGDGYLTIGLVGPPTNDSINININGKQHLAATGDVFDIAPNPATTCQVRVQSFDMFEATIYATCTTAKPK